ncbi:MAG: hypothetical protein E7333_03090 [Clostridiales bacterium]|nr:hypothetical protein [Clostridiales bacterium]
MTTFNVLGCCILRDIFRIAKDEEMKVNTFVQSCSPASIVEDKQNQGRLSQDALSRYDWSNFTKRNVCLDINKEVQQRIGENPADYMLIDLSELRFPVDRYTLASGDSFCVTRNKFTKILQGDLDDMLIAGEKVVSVEPIPLTEEMLTDVLEKYVEFLRKVAYEKRIIVVENYLQYRVADDTAMCFHEYHAMGIHAKNQLLHHAYETLKKLLPNAHYIQMPEHCLGDASHFWGKDPLHFADEYYLYLYEAVKKIISGDDNTQRSLTELRETYSVCFALLEKQKRMEYYIAHCCNNENFLRDCRFDYVNQAKDGQEKAWQTSLSKEARYEAKDNILVCGNQAVNWAILQQQVDLEKLGEKTVTLSVKYQTFEGAALNIAIRCTKPDGSRVLIATKQCTCDQYTNIDSLVAEMPKTSDAVSADVIVYCNHPNAKARVVEAKLEMGSNSSLF